MSPLDSLGIIAGSGAYPVLLARAARKSGVGKIVAAAFDGETNPDLSHEVDVIEWMRVGQLARLLAFFKRSGVEHAMMAGQISPKNLFDLRPDWKALLLVARLKRRNAETIFGGIAEELALQGVNLLPAITFLDDFVAPAGVIAGRGLTRREESDVAYGFEIAREVSRLDIGQTVVVKNATVVAVEALEGTNEAIKRGGTFARDGAVMIKVSKPNQDMRFDVPVIGLETVRVSAEAKVRVIALEAGRTLLLEKDSLCELAIRSGLTIIGR